MRHRRVLHVIPSVAARYGGPSAAVLGMCRSLARLGIQTTIATTDADGPGRLPVRTGEPEMFEGVPAIFFRRAFGEGFKWSSGIGAWLSRNVGDFDIVHVHAVFSHASIVAGLAARRASIPYVVRPLGTLDPWSLGRKRLQKQVLLRVGAGQLLAGASAIHYTTREEQRLAETALPRLRSGWVIPIGIDDEFFDVVEGERGADARPYVLALSRLDTKKNLEVAIRAFHVAASAPTCNTWRFVIAGAGDPAYVATLRRLAAGGPAAESIEFRGWVSGAEKLALIRGASLFVSPSKQENFGISAAEALAAGVPVLLSSGVNLAAEVEKAGAGWQAGADDFPAALAGAMSDETDRNLRGDRARSFAEAFRWTTVARSLNALYESLQTQTRGADGLSLAARA